MSQGAITLLLALADPGNWRVLADWLRVRGDRLQANPQDASGLCDIGQLHFLSLFVIPPEDGNGPLLALEANFDGDERAFLEALVDRAPDLLHGVLGRCAGYPGANATRPQLIAYLESAKMPAQLFFVGCPGRSVQQIEAEAALAARIERVVRGLGEPAGRRFGHVLRVWRALTPEDRQLVFNTPRRPFFTRERLLERPLGVIYDLLRVPLIAVAAVFFLLVLLQFLGFSLPEAIAPPREVVATSVKWAACLLVLAGVVAIVLLFQLWYEFPMALTRSASRYVAGIKIAEILMTTLRAIPDFALLVGLVALLAWHWELIAVAYICLLQILLVIACLAVVVFLGLLALIGVAELIDEVFGMRWDPDKAIRIGEREQRGTQNHFISVTTIRPGPLRWIVLWVWLRLVHVAAGFLYNPHGLFNIPSIHFARWLIVPGRRLLFVPNYDGSFGGYLGQFATFGAGGVSGIWGNTVGFPRTFLLFFGGGARDEQRFKCRARDSQIESLFWYRRYPDLSVSAIERNAAIREDLLRFARGLEAGNGRMSEAELDAFLRRF